MGVALLSMIPVPSGTHLQFCYRRYACIGEETWHGSCQTAGIRNAFDLLGTHFCGLFLEHTLQALLVLHSFQAPRGDVHKVHTNIIYGVTNLRLVVHGWRQGTGAVLDPGHRAGWRFSTRLIAIHNNATSMYTVQYHPQAFSNST